MLVDPGRQIAFEWHPRRLVVQHMNGLSLRYEDEVFDGIFSSSAIEHFGTLRDVRLAAEEMYRVLRPGGVLSLSTEFRLEGPPPGIPGALLLDLAETYECIVGDLGWAPVGTLRTSVSAATRMTELPFQEALADGKRAGGPTRFPHVVLREGERVWTSVHLALRKHA